jgi:hypothetical protein
VADRPLRPATHRRLGEPLPHQQANGPRAHPRAEAEATFSGIYLADDTVSGISSPFELLSRSLGQVAHVLLTRSPLEYPRRGLSARLACVKHAASVRPEPGSNSPIRLDARNRGPGTSLRKRACALKAGLQSGRRPKGRGIVETGSCIHHRRPFGRRAATGCRRGSLGQTPSDRRLGALATTGHRRAATGFLTLFSFQRPRARGHLGHRSPTCRRSEMAHQSNPTATSNSRGIAWARQRCAPPWS